MDVDRTESVATVADAVVGVAVLVDDFRTELHRLVERVATDGSNRDLIDTMQSIERAVRSSTTGTGT